MNNILLLCLLLKTNLFLHFVDFSNCLTGQVSYVFQSIWTFLYFHREGVQGKGLYSSWNIVYKISTVVQFFREGVQGKGVHSSWNFVKIFLVQYSILICIFVESLNRPRLSSQVNVLVTYENVWELIRRFCFPNCPQARDSCIPFPSKIPQVQNKCHCHYCKQQIPCRKL